MTDKTLDMLYQQRAEAFQLAMAMAHKLGYHVGVRYDDDDEEGAWPVLVIRLRHHGEVALHAKRDAVEASILAKPYPGEYDGHSDDDKSARIRMHIREYLNVDDTVIDGYKHTK